ncbi:MAG: hypothetical protein K9L59_15885 [Desulfobacterales bacterium]|nr:hypothetical protein [Desulfobacterales bacterium]
MKTVANQKTVALITAAVFLLFSVPGFAGPIKDSRLTPADKVTVLQNGKKIAQYTEEMPVPGGVLLETTGRCAVRLGSISFVAEDQARFAVDTDGKDNLLKVERGTVYFGLSGLAGNALVFLTPEGAVYSDQVLLNASSDGNLLEGYVRVTEETSEVGVLRGGSMNLVTHDGPQLLRTGQSMILAKADIADRAEHAQAQAAGAAAGGGSSGWWAGLSTAGKIGVAASVTFGIGAAVVAIESADDDDASPSTP